MIRFLLILQTIIGAVTALWSSAGDASVLAAAGACFASLNDGGTTAEMMAVRAFCESMAPPLQKTWVVVFWLGVVTTIFSLLALGCTIRSRKTVE